MIVHTGLENTSKGQKKLLKIEKTLGCMTRTYREHGRILKIKIYK